MVARKTLQRLPCQRSCHFPHEEEPGDSPLWRLVFRSIAHSAVRIRAHPYVCVTRKNSRTNSITDPYPNFDRFWLRNLSLGIGRAKNKKDMTGIRQFVALVTAAALLANTVSAAACCCLPSTPRQHSCCSQISPLASSTVTWHACSAAARVTETSHGGCCCLKSQPLRPPPLGNNAKPLSSAADLSLAPLSVLPQVVNPVSQLSQHPPDEIFLSGPALLARFCIWLN